MENDHELVIITEYGNYTFHTNKEITYFRAPNKKCPVPIYIS